jgi:hypothetical protein
MKIGAGLVVTMAGVLLVAAPASAGNDGGEVGLLDLIARLGAGNEPTGVGVVVAQAEASAKTGEYQPDQSHPEFTGKTFTALSGAAGTTSHATIVGRNFYGLDTSIAPGLDTIYLYSAAGMVTSNLLRTGMGSSFQPLTPPGGISIINDSWVGTFGDVNADNDCLRRADLVAARDNVLFVNGVNNGGANPGLMINMFNGITVGRADGNHTSGPIAAGYDGAGRNVPHLVAPGSATSWAAPVVSAGAALMLQTANDELGPSNPNAIRAEVIKSVLLAGANHRDGWSNDAEISGPLRGTTTTPLDPVFGADLLNVDRGHLILTGGEHEGSPAVPPSAGAPATGWDLHGFGFENRYYRFAIPSVASEVSIVATWHRKVLTNFTSWFNADFDLVLWRVDGGGGLETMIGDDGLDDFSGGNVASLSPLENVEHLYITDLQPGEYVLEIQRLDGISTAFDVAVSWIFPEVAPSCPCDFDGDGDVDVDDLLAVLGAWGAGAGGDCTGDGSTDVNDLLQVLADWGPC